MRKHVLFFVYLGLLFSVVACSSSENQTIAANEDFSVAETSRSVESSQSEEDLDYLLVKKWENESSKMSLDLKIDGTFEAIVDGDVLVQGTWKMSEDQKILKLSENSQGDGKGGTFSASYTIIDMTIETMKVKDEEGKELIFSSLEE